VKITNVVGTPIIIDSATQNRLFGHYVRAHIGIYMDLFRCLFHEILVERNGFTFNVEVQLYVWLPDFRTHCKNIGHNVFKFCWLHPQ
jgi:hypothetical protein